MEIITIVREKRKGSAVPLLSGFFCFQIRYTVREDPRLREQDWGNLQNAEQVKAQMRERREFGMFMCLFICDLFGVVTTLMFKNSFFVMGVVSVCHFPLPFISIA